MTTMLKETISGPYLSNVRCSALTAERADFCKRSSAMINPPTTIRIAQAVRFLDAPARLAEWPVTARAAVTHGALGTSSSRGAPLQEQNWAHRPPRQAGAGSAPTGCEAAAGRHRQADLGAVAAPATTVPMRMCAFRAALTRAATPRRQARWAEHYRARETKVETVWKIEGQGSP